MAAVPPQVVVPPPVVPEIDQIGQILTWIGFTDATQRLSIIDDAFNCYMDMLALKEKEMFELSDSFSRRTATTGRIVFGIRRTKKLKSLLHWVQDFYRVSSIPSIEGLTEITFTEALTRARQRADVRELMLQQSEHRQKVASPGPLVSENKWTDWEPKFANYLSTILGINGIPLSYVIRENDGPDITGPHANFSEECVARAPLSGVAYEADRSTVHQALVTFTTGQPSENWIKGTNRAKNGRISMKALRDHFSGEGNATRRIAEADRLKETLHYKNERSLPFETFLTKCEKMYNIYDQHGEEMKDDAKVRFLFKKILHPGLANAIEAMKAKITTEAPGSVTYTTVANHLSTAISEQPDFLSKNRMISVVETQAIKGTSIHNADGSINIGHHPNWTQLSPEDRRRVNDERARLGKGKSRRTKQGAPNLQNQLTQLKKANAKHKRTIAGLKTDPAVKTDSTHDKDIEQDAGDAFGGKKSKKG